MRRVQVTYEGQRFVVYQKSNKFDVTTCDTLGGTYSEKNLTFEELQCWVWNMSDNHDISAVVCRKLYDKFSDKAEGFERL